MSINKAEKNLTWLIVLTLITVSIGGAVEILPMVFSKHKDRAIDGLQPYQAIDLEGRDIYIREGCHVCHTQMVRTLYSETERYGPYSVAGEDVYEHPFLWGSKRTGPDLARVGGRYSDEWHRVHLLDPRSVVPVSNMPAYPWLFSRTISGDQTAKKMRALKKLGVPYSEEAIDTAKEDVEGVTEAEALISYLQTLGLDRKIGGTEK